MILVLYVENALCEQISHSHKMLQMQRGNSILSNIEVNQDNGSCALDYYWFAQMPPSFIYFLVITLDGACARLEWS